MCATKAHVSAFFYWVYPESDNETNRDAAPMSKSTPNPPLRPLHPDSSLISSKLEKMELETTEALILSLTPGRRDSLKTRSDGTILDGHHRIHVLRKRDVKVANLPREIIEKQKEE